ncbi:helix-turn-helix domain-containing protein [Hylemonella gracilis]|uniref:helix-turn-helix domain-containing protein n=1 Tax=Hylemonella gracilis TaxID=80880 RepID=UPI0009DCB603|nr:helix-turn-helix transcriptional regulator [Hylemonella gracilis]
MSLGARLTELRLRKGASLQDVADAVEVSKTHIWALEKGGTKNPSLDLLKKLAEHFNVTVEYLAGTGDAESLVEVEAQQFFRDFKSLSDAERSLLLQTLEVFKKKNARGDAET